MEGPKAFKSIAIWGYFLVVFLAIISVDGQIFTSCSTSMVSTFTPCLNFVTGSSNNGSFLSAGCCTSLKSIVSASVDCACLLIAANVPVQLPINQPLALLLPRICNMDPVPLQCKPSGTPLPALGPTWKGPTPPPTSIAASPFSPEASEVVEPALEPALAPGSETNDEELTPAVSPPVESEGPSTLTANARIRRVLNSQASSSGSSLSNYVFPTCLPHVIIGAILFFISF